MDINSILLLSVLSLIPCGQTASHVTTNPIVALPENGPIRGFVDEFNGTQVFKFLGIPYAEPPINELKFERPKPYLQRWNSTYNATFHRSACMQSEEMKSWYPSQSEDCFYFNVFVPQIPSQKKLPVMVRIHGGERD